MKLFIITTIVLMAGCATSNKPDTKEIKLVANITQPCKFVREEKCVSIRENGAQRCYKKLKKKAADEGVNTIVIVSAEEISDITDTTNNLFSQVTTTIKTKFYKCDITYK